MIDLKRNPSYDKHNIPLDPNNYYRGLNAESYEDLWETNENGDQIMRGRGKGGTGSLSFQKSFPNDLYVNRLVKANTIIEGTDAMPIERLEESSGYTYVAELKRRDVELGESPIRVFQRRVLGGGAIHEVHVWDKVFDSFPQLES